MMHQTPVEDLLSLRQEHARKRAEQVALLAFRCARHDEEKQDVACAIALKAYQAICPDVENAADEVVAIIKDALRARPHWAAL